jgi:hypothetical protein
MELSPEQVDEKLKDYKRRIFNEKIQAALAKIQPTIATLEASAPSLSCKRGFDLKNPALYLQGDLTYARAHDLFQQRIIQHIRSDELGVLNRALFDLSHIVPEEGQKKRIPTKAQRREAFEEIAHKLTLLQKTWPTEATECQRILNQNKSFENAIAVFRRLETLCDREQNYLVEFGQLMLETIREGSITAFARYEKSVIRNLTAKCEHCHKQDSWHTDGQFVLTLKTCSACKGVFYCNEECQRADWLRHKITCKHR